MSRWARTARGEVDCVALSSHCASRVRVLPGWSAPPRARRGPARASARGRREPGPGPCPIPSCLRPGPQDHRPSPRGCSLGGPARRRGRGARRCPDSRRDPARGLSHRHLRVGVHPAPARKTDANKIASAGTRIRTATATRLGRAPAARTTTNPRPGASARTAWTIPPGSGDVQGDRASAGADDDSPRRVRAPPESRNARRTRTRPTPKPLTGSRGRKVRGPPGEKGSVCGGGPVSASAAAASSAEGLSVWVG